MKVLSFWIAKDILGKSSFELEEYQGKTVGEFRQYLNQTHPEFTKLNTLAIAVNEEYAEDTAELNASDVVALIPPVSGG